MLETLIKVEGVSKKFCRDLKRSLWYGVQDIATELAGKHGVNVNGLRKHEFWAVKNVDFELKRGECLGLIGHNGAGKSTLLKMLNGLIKPNQGSITLKGRVGALIELGAGFNPILTGRENVYINGQVLGFTRKEIDEKFEAILDFAEIGEFIDAPVRSYSSGMKVRLGFAIAAHMEPDILLIDEVLAVGDGGFRVKCLNVINELLKKTAVIFVSHSMPQVSKVATKVLVMNKGKMDLMSRHVDKGIERYFDLYEGGKFSFFENGLKLKEYCISGAAECKEPRQPCHERDTCNIDYLADLFFTFEFSQNEPLKELGIVIRFYDKSLISVATCQNRTRKMGNTVRLQIPCIQFGAGSYDIDVFFVSYDEIGNEVILAYYKNLTSINIVNSPVANHSSFQLLSKFI